MDWASGSDICHMEGHADSPRCSRCGFTDYAYLGFLSGVARRQRAREKRKEEARGDN